MRYQQGDKSEDHLAAVMFNAMAIIHNEEMIRRGVLPAELDDMPNYLPPAGEPADEVPPHTCKGEGCHGLETCLRWTWLVEHPNVPCGQSWQGTVGNATDCAHRIPKEPSGPSWNCHGENCGVSGSCARCLPAGEYAHANGTLTAVGSCLGFLSKEPTDEPPPHTCHGVNCPEDWQCARWVESGENDVPATMDSGRLDDTGKCQDFIHKESADA